MGKDLKGKELGKGITQRKDGRYQARITATGRKNPITIYNTDLKALKEEKLKIEYETSTGLTTEYSTMTLDEWYEQWMSLYNLHLKDTTLNTYAIKYKLASKYIGHMQLKDIKVSNVQYTLNILHMEGYAYATISSVKGTLYTIFNKAIQCGFMSGQNPCNAVVLPPDNTPEIKALTQEEIDKFFQAIKRQRYRDLFYILLNTGMRLGEACALEWTDIDFDKKTIDINRTLVRTKQWDRKKNKIKQERYTTQTTSPKTYTSNRKIPMNADVEFAFKRWKVKQDNDKLKYGRDWGKINDLLKRHPNLIFTTSTGGVLTPNDAWDYCNQGVSHINEQEILEAELEGREPKLLNIHPHILRHTFATHCLQSGMNPIAVQKIMGHASLDMLNHYTHPEDDFAQDEFEKYTEKYGREKYIETVTGCHNESKIIDISTRFSRTS